MSALLAFALAAPSHATNMNPPRAVRVETTVNASAADVWRAWSTSEGAMEFFGPKANIQLAIGGPYEIYFDPADDRQGTKGLKILSYLPQEMISFQWNAPPDMPTVRNGGTWVAMQMSPIDATHTKVALTHLGFQDGEEWERAFLFFTGAWNIVLKRFERRFKEGPIDWSKEK